MSTTNIFGLKLSISRQFFIYAIGGSLSLLMLFSSIFADVFFHQYNLYSYAHSARIHESVRSNEYHYAVMVSIGMSIILLAEYILDVIAHWQQMKSYDLFISRGLILAVLLIPDTIMLGILIPRDYLNLIGYLSVLRSFAYMTSVVAHLFEFGGEFFNSDGFLLLYIAISLNSMLRSFGSIVNSESIQIGILLTFLIIIIILLIAMFKWFRINRISHKEDNSVNIFTCSVYLVSLSIVFIFYIILHFGLRLRVDANSTIPSLVCNRFILVVFLIMFSIVDSRNHNSKIFRATQLLERKRTFVRLISHEIRTPLNIVVTGMRLISKELIKRNQDDELIDTITDAQTSCDIAVTLLDDLLAYEKIEAGVLVLEKAEQSSWQLLVDSIRPFQIQARHLGIGLQFSNEEHLQQILQHVKVNVDKNKFNQVMRNLISNALKFTPAGGSVTVDVNISSERSVRRSGFEGSMRSIPDDKRLIRIDIIDTGHGIEPENLPRLFREIVQFNPGKLQNGGGSGLGLWLTRSIIELHNGTISVHSDGIGKGCTFSITLPLIDSNPSSTSTLLSGTVIGNQSSQRPLRVEGGDGELQSRPSPMIRSKSTSARMASGKTKRGESISTAGETPKSTRILPSSWTTETSARIQNAVGSIEGWFPFSITGKGLHRIMPADENDVPVESKRPESPAAIIVNYELHEPLSPENDRGGGAPSTPQNNQEKDRLGNVARTKLEHSYFSVEEYTGSTLRCLMVDDSSMGRKMLRRAIRDKFAVIEEAADGDVAVRKIEKAIREHVIPDVILMDYQMPNMDGPTAVKHIRGLGYKGVILGVTGNALPEDIITFISHGADQVLTKPINMSLFDNIIDGIQNGYRV